MFELFKKFIKNNEKSIDLNINIPKSALLIIGDRPPKNAPFTSAKHMGRFLRKEHNAIIIGVCAVKSQPLLYKEKESIIHISFTTDTVDGTKSRLYTFPAKILKMRKVAERDNFTFEDMHSIFFETRDKNNYDLFIFEIEATEKLTERQRREFFRINMATSVYYKPDVNSGAENDNQDDFIKGYIKLETINISAGGFKCKSKRYIEPGKVLDCMMLIGYEALPVLIKVLDVRLDQKSQKIENKEIYILRMIFLELHDDIRDRMTMHIFEYQQKAQKFRQKIKKLKESYKNKHI